MWKRILNALKGGLAKIGIIKGLDKIADHKDVSINEAMMKKIEMWMDLYQGYHEPFHKVQYFTLNGQKTRRMKTMNIAKVSAEEMASLVFNEKCDISIGDKTLFEDIKEVFRRNNFDKEFQTYLEYSFAHGGMVVKPYVDKEGIKLSFVTADCFIPLTWRNGTITEAVFLNEFVKRKKNYTHLEWHLWEDGKDEEGNSIKLYVIKNEVYESKNGDDLGTKVPLKEFFPDLEETAPIGKLKRPLFSYIKPNIANNVDIKSPLGIPIYANAIDTMVAIDTAFDSFHREFRLGKKRIIVPDHMVKTIVDPATGRLERYFDSNDETYEAFPQDMDEANITDISVELRVEEHIAGINALLNLYAMQTGFSTGSFSFDGKSMKTATEVVSEQSKTFKSKQSHEVIIEAALRELIESIVDLAELYGIFEAPEKYEVTITFDDSVAEDRSTEIKHQSQMIIHKMQSRRRAIMKVQGVTEKEAVKILKEIYDEEMEIDPVEISARREQELLGEEE